MSEAKKFSDLPAATTPEGCKAIVLEQNNGLKTVGIGPCGNQLLPCIQFPTNSQLIEQGFMTEAEKFKEEPYFKGILRWLAANYKSGGVFLGIIVPNSKGFMLIQMYDLYTSSPTDDGLPQNCVALVMKQGWTGIITFGTNQGNFFYDKWTSPTD